MSRFASRVRGWAVTIRLAIGDVRRLSPLTAGLLRLLPFVLQRRRRPFAKRPTAVFLLDGLQLEARPRDWCAIEEVLLDGEYDFVADLYDGRGPSTIVDLGANIGAFTARCLAIWPSASVLAVEPARDTCELLTSNQHRNAMHDWTVVRMAVWNEDGFVSFEAAEQSTGSRVARPGDDTVQVPAARLQTLLSEHLRAPVDLLKMDIEGAEEAVLVDAEPLLDDVRTLIVEIHPGRCDHDRVVALLRSHFTHISYVAGRKSSKPLLVASRKPLPLPAYRAAEEYVRHG